MIWCVYSVLEDQSYFSLIIVGCNIGTSYLLSLVHGVSLRWKVGGVWYRREIQSFKINLKKVWNKESGYVYFMLF